MPPRSGTQSVERAIAILESFTGDEPALGITEIARRVHLTVSTTHRLVRALVVAGYVEQETRSEHYRLGLGIAVLGQRALEQSGYDLARPVLAELVGRTGESCSLGVRNGHGVLVIESESSVQQLRFGHHAGSEIAMHASAMGKVLMAFSGLPADEVIAEITPAESYTAHTLTEPADLVAELDVVRRRGHAVNVEERYLGVSGVAAPVLSASGIAHAAVSVQGPSVRLTVERLTELGPIVRDAANEIAALVVRT